MNLRTSLALALLVGLGAAVWVVGPQVPPWLGGRPTAEPTVPEIVRVLQDDLTPQAIRKITVRKEGKEILVLTSPTSDTWTLDGSWPTRPEAARQLVERLCNLRPRFRPVKVSRAELGRWGLATPACVLEIEFRAGGRKDIELGIAAADARQFSPPTYARLAGSEEVLELGPGLIELVTRPPTVYRQLRLFEVHEEPREPGSPEKVERLAADRISVYQPEPPLSYTLTRKDEAKADWRLTGPLPTEERVARQTINAIREAFADFWADQFVESKDDLLSCVCMQLAATVDLRLRGLMPQSFLAWRTFRTGLDRPIRLEVERVIHRDEAAERAGVKPKVDRRAVVKRVLLIGGLAPRPATAVAGDTQQEYRYARLEDNEQIFITRTTKLSDLLKNLDSLRDPHLADLRTDDIKKVTVRRERGGLILTRVGLQRWQVRPLGGSSTASPIPADSKKVEDLLRALTEATAKDSFLEEVAISAGLVGLPGLGGPAALLLAVHPDRVSRVADTAPDPKVTLEIEVEERDGRKRLLQWNLLRHDGQRRLLAVKHGEKRPTDRDFDFWPTVKTVDDALLVAARRPLQDYRGKLFDLAESDLRKIEVISGKNRTELVQADGKWKMTTPAAVEIDLAQGQRLVSQMISLDPREYFAEQPTEKELADFGLAKSELAVALEYLDKNENKVKREVLRVGSRIGDRKDYYARLDSRDAVFAIGEELHTLVGRDALELLPLEIWSLQADRINRVRVEKAGNPAYTLEKKDGSWKLAEPAPAPALTAKVQELLNALSMPRCQRQVAFDPEKVPGSGLKTPLLRIELTVEGESRPRTLVIGGPHFAGWKRIEGRFTSPGPSGPVCVLLDGVIRQMDRPAQDFLDPVLAAIPAGDLASVQIQQGDRQLTLTRKGETWNATLGGTEFAPDEVNVNALTTTLFNLKADSYADYGPRLDLARFGLDKPFATLTLNTPAKKEVLLLGKEAQKGRRYALLQGRPAVAILNVQDTAVLSRSGLGYVNHQLLREASANAVSVQRVQGKDTLLLKKADRDWEVAQPVQDKADEKAVSLLLQLLAELRAREVADFPAKEVKKFGLETPAATVTVEFTRDGKTIKHVIKVGDEIKGSPGERYVRVDDGQVVGVLAAPDVELLLAAPIRFRDHLIGRFDDADGLILERGPRKATFTRPGGTWKMTAPIEAAVNNDEVQEFVDSFASLRADELVADDPMDLEPYGLKNFQARWRFQHDGKDVQELLVGKLHADGKRAYARLGAKKTVFLLSEKQTARALGEFRNREVWEKPLDSLNVDRIRYTRAGKTLMLEKVGNDWQVTGKPNEKVNARVVENLLAAMRGLKAQRWAVDRDANLGLFGLDRPAAEIELSAGQDKQVLHLGGDAGAGKQVYARAVEKGRTDVIVLTPEDTAKLLLDVAAFTQKP